MPCYHPLNGWLARRANPSGKRSVVFAISEGFADKPLQVPCGQCIGCRLERSRQWAIRCVHEAAMHERNCFITLTYRDDCNTGTLELEDFQRFMKRLRKRYGPVRYFHCGEYGEEFERPHYHAALFGHDFSDKKVWSVRDGVSLYRSRELESLWPFGFSTVGELTFESAAYIARYVTKKITGKDADRHYLGRKPEYVTMSRRPGIGSTWLQKFCSDVFPSGNVVVRGRGVFRAPKAYERMLVGPDVLWKVKIARKVAAALSPDNTPQRLIVRGEAKEHQARILKRSFEHEASRVRGDGY